MPTFRCFCGLVAVLAPWACSTTNSGDDVAGPMGLAPPAPTPSDLAGTTEGAPGTVEGSAGQGGSVAIAMGGNGAIAMGGVAGLDGAAGSGGEHPGLDPEDCEGDVDGLWDSAVTGGALTSGPLVGHVTDQTALIWAHAGEGNTVEVMYQRQVDCPDRPITVSMPPRADSNHTSLGSLTELVADMPYRYQVIVNGSVAASGTFTTAPVPNQPTQFKYMFGSCSRVQRHPDQPVWQQVLAHRPAFQILNGDTVYADTTDYNQIWARNIQQRDVSGFAELIRQTPTYSTWDDHDFGKNDGDGSLVGKETSLKAWKDVWANPSYGTADLPGVFHTFQWGNVEFFVVDNRYHRVSGKYLGDAQMDWLVQKLQSSQAVFKIIVHGGTIRRAGDESWFTRDGERDRLMGLIRDEGVSGVVFHGGDVHQNWFNPYPLCPRGSSPEYDVYEIVSSGLSYAARYTTVAIDTTVTPPTLTYELFEEDASQELGTLSLQPDGSLKHEAAHRRSYPNACQELMKLTLALPQ